MKRPTVCLRSPFSSLQCAAGLALAGMLVCGTALAQTETNIYVDATSGVAGNTTLANGSTFTPPLNGTTGADNNWEERTTFASGGNVLEAGGEAVENAPELCTTLTGLTPGKRYNVYVHFWDGSGAVPDWNVRAGFTSNPGTNTLFANPSDAADIGASNAVLASTLTYSAPPTLFVESDRTMYAGLIGSAVANGSGQIMVYIDDMPSSIGANNRTWYDGLSYAEAIDPLVGPTVITPSTVPIGGSAQATATVKGTAPFSFQWLSNGVPVLNATNQTLLLSNLQLANSGASYRLVVSNSPFGVPSVATNDAAVLTVRAAIDLTWVGVESAEWNTTALNWDSGSDGIADTAYNDGDRVRFTDSTFQTYLSLLTEFFPSRVTVSNEFNEYTFVGPGGVGGVAPLIKEGAAGLTLDSNNSYSGGTRIGAGTLTIGTGLGTGSIGTGPVTNNGALVINRTGTLTIPGAISGTGGITINTAGGNTVGNVILSGTNSYSGTTLINGGTLTLNTASALGNSPNVTVFSTTAGASGGTRVALNGGIAISGKELILNTVFDSGRTMLFGSGTGTFTNTWNGPVTINGDGLAQFGSASGGTLVLNGDVSGPSVNNVLSRGTGANLIVNGKLLLSPSSFVQTADGASIVINSTGNTWGFNRFANAGRWTIGANNAIPTASVFVQQATDPGILDLNGFNQQLTGIDVGAQITVTNSSTSADSTFTFAGGSSTFGGIINGGSRKLNLTIASGTLAITNAASLAQKVATVTVNNGAVLQLDFDETNTVSALVLNGVSQTPGVYSAASSSPLIAGIGAIRVASPVAPNPTNMTFSVSGGTLALTWPGSHLGWYAQSNSVDIAGSNLWFDIPGSQSVTNLNIAINPALQKVFFRLRRP